ncbi:MAG: 5-dehydro-2-deoxygluconokinase [Kiloniellaceae bacterium]|nr:5-dehydro-2-deoxygluconokinase [Kiloniellaceae bacterium]
MTGAPPLDVITLGRASVDLYGQQIGGRLEDMASFAKSVGGSPTNIAIGAARLGLRTGLVTRVGKEQFGSFILEQLGREGVETRGVVVDPERLTALAILGVRSDSEFPLLFYRDNCADMALCEADIEPAYIGSAAALQISGTHLTRQGVRAASLKAVAAARAAGRKVVFDIDYRPNLWGLGGHDSGAERYRESEEVTAVLQTVVGDCDLIVGTEEEIHVAGGSRDTRKALCRLRAVSEAVLVLKRGPMGCIVFDGAIPDDIEGGIKGPGFPVEIYNVLGAGDAFMAGFLRGWLRGEPLATCCTWANACGAFAVSRLLCSPESPTWAELQHFLAKGSTHSALRQDPQLNHLHWATTRRGDWPQLLAFAIDHRIQFEQLAERTGASLERVGAFKRLAVEAAAKVAGGRPGFGMLLDGSYGRQALFEALDHGFWIGRPVEVPASRPLAFECGDLGSALVEWPLAHTVKCLVFYHPDDEPALRQQQEAQLLLLYQACRRLGRELMVEIIAGKHGSLESDTVAKVLATLYALGIKPDWWKLEPQPDAAAWQAIDRVIEAQDTDCRGIVLLGLEAPEAQLAADFAAAQGSAWVRGFAIGRTIFAAAAERWLAGTMTDREAVDDMVARFDGLVGHWTAACGGGARLRQGRL